MYGFSKNVCKWLEDYFCDRMQYTRLGQVLSSGVLLEQGVYQGSPLGPLLFIIYINDIVRVHKNVFCNMYADDTIIVCKDRDVNKAVEGSMLISEQIGEWCSLNNKHKENKKYDSWRW